MTPYRCLDCRYCQIEPEPLGGLHYLCRLLLKTFRSSEMTRKTACREFRAQDEPRPA